MTLKEREQVESFLLQESFWCETMQAYVTRRNCETRRRTRPVSNLKFVSNTAYLASQDFTMDKMKVCKSCTMIDSEVYDEEVDLTPEEIEFLNTSRNEYDRAKIPTRFTRD